MREYYNDKNLISHIWWGHLGILSVCKFSLPKYIRLLSNKTSNIASYWLQICSRVVQFNTFIQLQNWSGSSSPVAGWLQMNWIHSYPVWKRQVWLILCNVWSIKTWPSQYITIYCDGLVFYGSDVISFEIYILF